MFCNYSENLRNFAWQFHLKNISEANLTKQNLPVFHSCAVNSLHFNKSLQTKKICSRSNEIFDLWWNPSVSHFSWEKKEILQFFILAGQKKNVFVMSWSKQIPTTLCPNFFISWPNERWIIHSDTLENDSHTARIHGLLSWLYLCTLKINAA